MNPRRPMSSAVRALLDAGVAFTDHVYEYREHGGTAWAAEALGLPAPAVVKTLVMQDDARAPLPPDVAERHSGYRVGSTSPFGLRKPLPIYMEAPIADLERAYVNGGRRGYLVGLAPADLVRLLRPTPVAAAQPPRAT